MTLSRRYAHAVRCFLNARGILHENVSGLCCASIAWPQHRFVTTL
jgi:hypothetical protein